MKVQIRLLLIFFIIIFNIGKAQNNIIYIAPFDSTTPYSIGCENLLSAFDGRIKKAKLNGEKMYCITKSLKQMDKKPYMDIRYKGAFYLQKQKFNFCGDEVSILINDIYYETSVDLINYINSIKKKNR